MIEIERKKGETEREAIRRHIKIPLDENRDEGDEIDIETVDLSDLYVERKAKIIDFLVNEYNYKRARLFNTVNETDQDVHFAKRVLYNDESIIIIKF